MDQSFLLRLSLNIARMEGIINNDELDEKIKEVEEIMSNLTADKHVTEEEFQNFMHRVNEVGKYAYLSLNRKQNL